jgi:hypothetical protein
MKAGGRVFQNTEVELKARERGGVGKPGRFEGSLGFRLDRRGAAKTVGQYNLEYGDKSDNYPQLKLRMGEKPTAFQVQVAQFLSGFLDRERELTQGSRSKAYANGSAGAFVNAAICIPGVPQQETSHDCGFFILEMILRCLQLSPKALRDLATASSVEIAMLPWPSQQQIFRRKAMLREVVDMLISAASSAGTGDVEVLMKSNAELRNRLRAALLDGGPSFTRGFERWAAGDWDLSPSPSRSRSRPSRDREKKGKKKKKAERSESADRDRRRRRRRSSSRRSGSTRHSESRSGSKKRARQAEEASSKLPSFTLQELESMSVAGLKSLCVQLGRLPPGIVERSDLVKVLVPLASKEAPAAAAAAATAAAAPAPAAPTTQAELEAMPTKALKSLCEHRGCLPPPPIERTDLIRALARSCGFG